MRRSPTYLLIATTLAVCSVAGQASAGQERQRSAPPSSSRGPSGPGSSSSQPSQGDRGSQRAQAERRDAPAPAPRNDTRQNTGVNGGPRGTDSRSFEGRSPQSRGNDNRGNDNRGNDNRGTDNRGSYDARGNSSSRQAVPAPRDRYIDLNRNGRDDRYDSRYDNRYDSRYDSRSYRSDRYSSYSSPYRYGSSRIIIAPREHVRFTRSWFSFRPLSRILGGLIMGYSLDFPTWYDPYIVGSNNYQRPYMPYGGVTFDIEPRDAELWVDGDYLGRASDYSSYDPPLTLPAGRHHVELTGRLYQSVEFDITVVAGQVIPYQGTLPYSR